MMHEWPNQAILGPLPSSNFFLSSGTDGNGSTGYGFTGERWEAYSGLVFLRARYYEPGMGRFVSKDPFDSAPISGYTLLRIHRLKG